MSLPAFEQMTPLEIARWAIAQAEGRAVVSTNFRPYEAVILHLATRVQPGIPVLWVDHGFNRPATYRFADRLTQALKLNLKIYHPRLSAAHWIARYGEPSCDDEAKIREFAAVMKLEPFERAMRELAPRVWLTALRKAQNPHRATLGVVMPDSKFGTVKVSPVFYMSDSDMESYLAEHNLPNEWDYFDPAKCDEKRECGLHT
ncbi:MAG: phosphoadenosine phosphosulfate reductase family protein [Verrucomicrobiae bacterium]|nr:phosphoadenosine phosphosulfate reductase family protein [Verrucomicrobiae bacterium]